MKATIKFFIVSAIVIAFELVPYSASGGFTEEIGGYKARGFLTTSDKKPENFYALNSQEKKDLIVATKMAATGYPDERNSSWKETDYYRLGMKSKNSVNNQAEEKKKLEEILMCSENSNLRVIEQDIYKTYVDEESGKMKRQATGEKIYTITGKKKDRLSAQIFEKKDGTIAVVFCGTDWGEAGVSLKGDVGDVIDDTKQFVHLAPVPEAYKEATYLLEAVMKKYPDRNIDVFGHSEGGGEGQYSVLHAGILNIIKNKSTRVVKYYGVNSAGLNGMLSVNDIKKELKTKEDKELVKQYIEENFVLIQNEGEFCSRAGYQFGRFVQVPNLGKEKLLNENGEEKTFIDAYGIKRKLTELNKKHGVDETRLKMEYGDLDTSEESVLPNYVVKEENKSPFDSEPETSPGDDGNGQMCPIPNNGNNGSSRRPVSRRRGGGGDTSARIW